MPYQNEFARGDSLWRLIESPSVQEFKGVIRQSENQETHALPAQLNPPRGLNNIRRVIAIDGSSVTHRVQNGYPGAEAALLHWAAIVLKLQAIRNIPRNYIPSPNEMREMEQCDTLSAVSARSKRRKARQSGRFVQAILQSHGQSGIRNSKTGPGARNTVGNVAGHNIGTPRRER